MVFYGKLRFVLSATLMLVPFVVFGLSYSNVYFFGKAKEEGKHQNLFSLSLVGVGINFLIFLFGFFAFFYIFSSFQEDSELWDMKRLILPTVMVEIEQRHHQEPVWNLISEVENWGFEAHYLERNTFELKRLTEEFIKSQNAIFVKDYENYVNNIIFIVKS